MYGYSTKATFCGTDCFLKSDKLNKTKKTTLLYLLSYSAIPGLLIEVHCLYMFE